MNLGRFFFFQLLTTHKALITPLPYQCLRWALKEWGPWDPHSFVKVGSWPVWFNTLILTHLALVALQCVLGTQLF